MADLKLNNQGDLQVIQLTADPVIIPAQQIPPCSTFELEDNSGDILVQEDGISAFCFEDAVSNEGTVIPEQVLGELAEFDISSEIETTELRLKRALQSPLGHISMYVLRQNSVSIVDNLYGNDIYSELSEGLTLNFIARVRAHTINAIARANLSNRVSDVQVSVLDQHTVQIHVYYNDNTPTTIIPITI